MATVSGNKEKPEFLRWWLLSFFFVGLAWFWAGTGGQSLWDRDEPRYSEATRYMVESGDWVVPHFNGAIRYDKPILVYWLMAIGVKIFGLGEFAVRAPAGIAGTLNALLILLLAYRFGAGFQARMLAAVCGLLYLLLMIVSKAATTDAILTLTVVAALLLHWEQIKSGFGWWRHLGFAAVLGLSLIHKGPVGPAIILMAMAVNAIWSRAAGERSPRTGPSVILQALAAVAVILAVSLPWAIAVWERTDGTFLTQAFNRHVVDRATKPLENHRGPIYYYIPALLAGTFPFTALTLAAMVWGCKQRSDARVRFLWSWLLPGLAMFSLVSTKLPHYVAPLLPALALMTGLWWQDRTERSAIAAGPSRGWWRAGAILVGTVGAGFLIAVPILASKSELPVLGPAIAFGILGGAGCIAGAVLWWRLDAPRAISTWAITWAMAAAVIYLWALPALEPFQASKCLMTFLKKNAPPGTQYCAVEYNEPTLVFYAEAPVLMLGSKGREIPKGRALLAGGKAAAIVLPADRWEKWQRETTEPFPASASIIHSGRYFCANRGKMANFVIVANFAIVSK